jgi:hypothetical protein
MRRAIALGILALTAMLAISAWAQAQSSTGQLTGLTNPGFEEPHVEEGTFVLVETIPGWKTTDTHFEIWGTGFKEVPAHEGTQFAELNAYVSGTLFQDSTGIPRGSVLEFTFAHRGRSGDDTMMLSIGDLGADNALGGGDDTILFAKQYTTGKDAWAVYDSTTEPKIKAIGNTVMFAYSAVSTATGELGEGNLLDAANFGVGVVSEAPPENAMKLDVEGGAFAFGYRTTEQPGFTEFPNTDSPHPGITRRNRADGEYFSYAQNTLETEYKAQESDLVFYPAKSEGTGALHPGKNPGDVAIARFTAMNDGEYHFNITAELIEENPTGAGVTIYIDDQAAAEKQLTEHLVPWATSSVVKLKKGQTVDIAVDSGEDKNWEKDHVLVTAKAWTTGPSNATVTMAPKLPTEFIVQTYGISGQGNQDQTPAFIGIEDGTLRIIEMPLEQALKNEKGVLTITRVQLDGGLVALKVSDRYLPDFAQEVGTANQYREVAPVFPPQPGEKDFISLESAHEPGTYLRHFSHNVFNGAKNDNEVEKVFQQDVTWHFHSTSQATADSNILEVPIYAQQTGMWCWATSGEMIMKYHGVSVAQCKQANDYYPKEYKEQFTDLKIDCCGFLGTGRAVDERIVLGGLPQFQDYGFTRKQTTLDSHLSFEEIKAQIDAKQPIGFAWYWKSPPGIPGGGHYMVLTGYKTVAGVPMIKINDPWPLNVDKESSPTEHTRWMTYDYWCNSEKHRHGFDEYDIMKNP